MAKVFQYCLTPFRAITWSIAGKTHATYMVRNRIAHKAYVLIASFCELLDLQCVDLEKKKGFLIQVFMAVLAFR